MSEQSKSLALGERLLAAAQEEQSWVVRMEGDTERKLTTVEIVDAYNERLIDPETYVWTNGMQAWQKLEAVDAIVDALHAEAARYDAVVEKPAIHDDSAMFSLATLVNGSQPQNADDPCTEDSGLIDLAALTAAAQPAEESPVMFAGDLFAAPVSAPPHAVAPAARQSRGLVGTLIAAVVVLSVVLGFKVLVRPEPVSATSPPSSSPSSAPESAPESAPSVPLAPAKTVATPAPAILPPPVASTVAQSAAPSLPPRQPSTRASSKVAPPRPAAVAPKAGGCPCPADDLLCNMRCATHP